MEKLNLDNIIKNDSFGAKCANARTNLELFYKIISEKIIDWIIWAEQHKDLLCDQPEDNISFNLVTWLNAKLGNYFDVTHDSHNGGHTDIKIQVNRNIWLGEAKRRINGDSYSLKGFRQLVDRYASGSPTCSVGGLLLYIVNKSQRKMKATDVLEHWKSYIQDNCDNSFENLEFIDPHQDRKGLSFITRHIHSTTGLKYTVHHHLVVLQHFPTDSQKK